MKPIQISQLGAITYTRSIVNAKTGKTVKRFAPRRNLIVDSGLDALVSNTWQSCFSYLVLGTGTTAFKRDSGLVTFTRSGNDIVASSNFFLNTDSGSLLKWDSGEECYVTYVSPTQATSNLSGTIGSGEATLYHVNRVGLASEVKRSGTETADSGDKGSSWNGTTGVVTLWRTLIGSAESGTVTYRELGWSHSGSAGNNIFGGDLLPGGGDTLVAGQQYKIKIQLEITISPTTASVPFAALAPPAWPAVDGDALLENIGISGGSIPVLWPNWGPNEPSNAGRVGLLTATTALRSPSGTSGNPDVSGDLAWENLVADSYVAGSFTRTFKASFSAGSFSSTAIRSICHRAGNSFMDGSYRLLLDSAESKLSSQALNNLTVRKTWGRVLVN